jgi:DNA-binding winged helix-turn-helix (wHTH) protein
MRASHKPQRSAVAQATEECTRLIDGLTEAIIRLATTTQEAAEVHRRPTGGRVNGSRQSTSTLNRCNHSEGHELSLNADETLAIETFRECPCCAARLWISIPSVGETLEAAALRGSASVPGLDIELTRRERQVLNVLHRSPYALRHEQLAALVWSEPDRTHDVRSVLYRLRRKLMNSGWAIPFQLKGKGVRLVPDPTPDGQTTFESGRQQPDEAPDFLRRSAA